MQKFYAKYNDVPSREALKIAVDEREDLNSSVYQEAEALIGSLKEVDSNYQWLLDETEKFCKDKAVYNAIMESIEIIDKKNPKKTEGSIPELLSDALAVTFDTHIGHDFLEDSEARYDFYHSKEERIGERIDANLLDTKLDTLKDLTKIMYDKKMEQLKEKITGKLIVKEFPTSQAHTGHFRHLLNELSLKKNFKPDIIYVDYLNICASQRLSGGQSVNSYTYVKAIAEELRGLAVEFNLPIWSATQTTRGGFSSSDVGLEDTSESFGLPATADLFIALIQTEELEELNQIMVKQLKNRYNDVAIFRRFVIGVDKAKMKWYDAEQSAQEDIIGTTSASPIEHDTESVFSGGGKKRAFKDFKV